MTVKTKLVKELRFGPPKSGKTSSIGNTYPTPMCILNFDPGGPDSIDQREIVKLTTKEFNKGIEDKASAWAPVTVLDFTTHSTGIALGQHRMKSPNQMADFINSVNLLFKFNPFKTIVLDSYSGLDDAIIGYILTLSGKTQMEIQHWGQSAAKKQEIVVQLLTLPCHIVVLAHSERKKDETLGGLNELPFGSGKLQEKIGVFFSQVLYSTTETNPQGKIKYVVYTKPKGIVKGVGMRFPKDRPDVCGATWKELYE